MPRVETILLVVVVLLTGILLFFTFERRNKSNITSQESVVPPREVPMAQPPNLQENNLSSQPAHNTQLMETKNQLNIVPRPLVRPQYRPYDINAPGPLPGIPQNIPVPAGTLKATNGLYTFNADYGYQVANGAVLPYQNNPLLSNGFFRPSYAAPSAFVGSVDAFLPFPEVNTPWEKAGILTSQINGEGKKELLNLYQRPIAPMQELWEYQVQDKDGFVIKLDQRRYLEDGDIIHRIIGKPGSWKAHIFVQNKYIWV